MNRNEAIKWCRDKLNFWPNTPRTISPEGWRWIMKDLPYQPSEMMLISDNYMSIRKVDVAGF